MAYLLDTNVLSNAIRQPNGRISQRIIRFGPSQICTSIIVSAELRYGAVRSGSVRLAARVEELLSAIEVLPFEAPADTVYAELRDHLEKRGTPIGPNDSLIAAQALVFKHTIVTNNEREFSRVPDLQVENWQA